ncbi:MAG: hypothetical protein HYY18_09185 [Planctomycetes bacterium]|nr:hypothetical protein [Planctomycetota bacterium]
MSVITTGSTPIVEVQPWRSESIARAERVQLGVTRATGIIVTPAPKTGARLPEPPRLRETWRGYPILTAEEFGRQMQEYPPEPDDFLDE